MGCSPHTIIRRVRSAVIDTLYSHTGRAWPHVVAKKLKSIPSFANRNTASAIVFVVFVVGVIAAISHCYPHNMNRRLALAVSSTGSADKLAAKASARPLVSVAQGVNVSVAGSSAIAKALPDNTMTLSFFGRADSNQAFKSLA